jgi:type IV secretory pathway VirJ component
MAENAASLAEALAQIQKDYEDTIAQIAENTKAKLAELQASLAEIAATLAALEAKQASINAIKNAPVYIPPVVTSPTTTSPSGNGNTNTVNNNTNIAQTFVTPKADPADVHLATLSAMKYGNAITVNTTTLEGIMKASGLQTPTATIAKGYGGKGALLD